MHGIFSLSSSKIGCPSGLGSSLVPGFISRARPGAIYKVILAVILLCASALGQQPNSKQPSKVSRIESSAEFWAGTVFDHMSSRGRHEGNHFLRNARGNLNAPRFYMVNGALFGLSFIFQKKYPRAMGWSRRAIGWLHIGVGFNNLNQPKGAFR
jgi:hypothetical protein